MGAYPLVPPGGGGSGDGSFWWAVRVTADTEDCAVSVTVRFHLPVGMTIDSWALGCSTAPVGSSITVSLKYYNVMGASWDTLANGTIEAYKYNQTESAIGTALTVAETYGAWVEVGILSVGSFIPGKGLVVYLKLTPT
jgi:hypothetical protein